MNSSHMLWTNRREAGRALARRFTDLRGQPGAILVALPRGGVPVAAAMAEELALPVVSWAVRKLAHPSSPEFAIGAVAPGGVILWDQDGGGMGLLPERTRTWLVREQQRELVRRQQVFGDPAAHRLRGRDLVVVDDGIATGMTAKAALVSLRQLEPASLALGVPVLDRRVLPDLEALVDRLEALAVVDRLRAVGEWFREFGQLDDGEVIRLLDRHRLDVDLRDPAQL